MLRLAICDDDIRIIEQIETYIEKIKNKQIEYDVFTNAEELLRYQSQNKEYDVYMLDIEMGKMSGLNLARRLREKYANALIVFLTSYSKYVYDVFEVITFDFILKPISFEKFMRLIMKVEAYLKVTYKNFIFSYRKNNYCIPCIKINYIEKIGRKAFIYDTNGNIYQCNMTLKEIWSN